MAYMLFSILTGAVVCLLLCSPFSLYPLLLVSYSVSIAVMVLLRRSMWRPATAMLPLLLLPALFAYLGCALLIFTDFSNPPELDGHPVSYVRTVIIYCDGNPEHYSVAYAAQQYKNKPLIQKPILAMGLKLAYAQGHISNVTSTENTTRAVQAFRLALLNHYPYMFYVAYSQRHPFLEELLYEATAEGSAEIVLIPCGKDPLTVSPTIKSALKQRGVSVLTAKSVVLTPNISSANASKLFVNAFLNVTRNR